MTIGITGESVFTRTLPLDDFFRLVDGPLVLLRMFILCVDDNPLFYSIGSMILPPLDILISFFPL